MSHRSLLTIIALSFLVTASAANSLISTPVRAGTGSTSVRPRQLTLKTHGLPPRPIDGNNGPRTAARVQASNQLKSQPSTASAAAAGLSPLSLGASGAAIRSLQSALATAGFNPGLPDGVFGPETLKAVVAFQKYHGLPAQGLVGPLTWQALGSYTASSGTGSYTASSGTGSSLVWAYAVPWDSANFNRSWAQNGRSIGVLSPYWYTLSSAGELVQHGVNHAALIASVHAQGSKIIPLVNNGGENDLIFSGLARETALDNLVTEAQTAGLDGYNVDFEGLSASDRAGLTSFVSALADRLHPLGKEVTVAVGPETHEDPVGDPEGYAYDYHNLGAVADRVVIMTYDHHDDTSNAGPVAPLAWVQSVTAYAVSQIPRSKILLGLADYGYDWSGTAKATTVTATQVESTLGKGQWDPTAAEPHLTYTVGNSTHVVWYEDGAAAASKAQVVKEYGLGGVALWYLGGEDSAFWPDVLKTLGN